jgi:hypothetical protein
LGAGATAGWAAEAFGAFFADEEAVFLGLWALTLVGMVLSLTIRTAGK